jgi:hypothetical protein
MKPVPFKTAKEYASPRWAFMKRRLIGSADSVYLDRMYVIQTPLFGIMFHRIFRPDRQRDLHDHPWNFLSIVLRGFYIEDTVDGRKTCRWFNWKRAEDRHSIVWCSRSPVWTLVFTGRKRRTWGFWTDGGKRWVRWTDYEKVDQP